MHVPTSTPVDPVHVGDMAHDIDDDSSETSFTGDNEPQDPSTTQHGRSNEAEQIETLARNETRNLRVWRLLLVLIMSVCFVTITVGTYLFLGNKESEASLESVSTIL
jgi:hypothetical protein